MAGASAPRSAARSSSANSGSRPFKNASSEPSGCTETTVNVFVEAALFDPIRTAMTGRRHQIISDARYRFERGLDPAAVAEGMEAATRSANRVARAIHDS